MFAWCVSSALQLICYRVWIVIIWWKMPQSAGIISGIQRMVLYETRAVSQSVWSFCCYAPYVVITPKTCDQSAHILTAEDTEVSLKLHISIILTMLSSYHVASWEIFLFTTETKSWLRGQKSRFFFFNAFMIKLTDQACFFFICNKLLYSHTGPQTFSLETHSSNFVPQCIFIQHEWHKLGLGTIQHSLSQFKLKGFATGTVAQLFNQDRWYSSQYIHINIWHSVHL